MQFEAICSYTFYTFYTVEVGCRLWLTWMTRRMPQCKLKWDKKVYREWMMGPLGARPPTAWQFSGW